MGKQKYTIDDVKNFLLLNNNENECILLSEQYESSKKPLLFQCKICGNEFSRNFEALKTVKHFCCPKCARSKSGGNHDKKTIDDVKEFLVKNDVNNECELISTEFVNSSTPLLFKCNICHQTFSRTFSQLQKKNRLFCCPQCGSLKGGSEKIYSTEYVRDYREGKSPMRRRMYMESHELHKDKDTQMRELENYVQELTSDIMEMIAQATPEEKQMLQQKIMILANKIQ